jgi:hypothetical protein
MPEESIRDLVGYVRRSLPGRGQLGAFLLSELDSSISRGADEFPRHDDEEEHPSEMNESRTLDEAELLEVLSSVFETYLVLLPAMAASLTSELTERSSFERVEITLDPSLLADELQQTGRARIDAVVPPTPNEAMVQSLHKIAEMVGAARTARD